MERGKILEELKQIVNSTEIADEDVLLNKLSNLLLANGYPNLSEKTLPSESAFAETIVDDCKNSAHRLQIQIDIAQYKCDTLQQYLDYALDKAIEITQSTIGYIYRYNEETKQFTLNSWSKDVMKECLVANPATCYELDKTGFWGEAVRQRKAIVDNHFQQRNPLKKGYPHGHVGLNRFLTIPVFEGDVIVGVVGVANKPNEYSNSDVLNLTLLMESVWKSVSQKLANEALIKSEERFRSIYDRSPIAYHSLSNKGIILDVNEKWLEFMGYSRHEVIGKHVSAFVYPDFLPKFNEGLSRFLSTGSAHKRENIFVSKQGEPVYFELDGTVIYNQTNQTAFTHCFLNNITDRKKFEASLLNSEHKYRSLVNEMQQGLAFHEMIYDENGTPVDYRFLEVNPGFEKLTGLKREDIIGKTVLEVLPGTEKYWIENYGRVALTGQPMHFENFSAQIGRYYETHAYSPGMNQFAVVISDITDRKKIENEAAETKLLFEKFLENSPVYVFIKDLQSKPIMISRNYEQLFNRPVSEILNSDITDIYGAEYASKIREEERAVVEEQRAITFVDHYRNRILELRKFPIIVDGAVKYIAGFGIDVTEKNKNEIKLKQSKEYAERLVQTANTLVIGLDENANVIVFNKAAEIVTGYTSDEVIGRSWFDTIVPKDRYPQVYDVFMKTRMGNMPSTFENEIITKSGEVCIIVWSNNAIVDENGDWNVISFGIDVTEQRLVEKERAEEQMLLKTIIGSSPFSIYVKDKSLRKIMSNKHSLENVSLKYPGRFVGYSDDEQYPPELAEGFMRDDLAVIERGESILGREEYVFDKNGEKIWLNTYKVPRYDADGNIIGLVGYGLNVTKERNMRADLARERILMKTLIDYAPIGMYIKDINQRKVISNPADLEFIGLPQEEVIGKTDAEIFGGQDVIQIEAEDSMVLNDAKALVGIERRLITHSGHERWGLITKVPFKDENNQIVGIIGFTYEITERKQLIRELLEAKDRAEESDRLKSAFLANMSHEIRTPMNGIIGFSELLKDPHLTGEEAEEYLKIIEQSGKRMLNIINDIIDISKMEAGQTELHEEISAVNPLLDHLCTFFKPEAKEKGLELKLFKGITDAQSEIMVDRTKLSQILTNLIKNAIKFTKTGSITISNRLENNCIAFEVRDTGIGMSNELQSKLFQRFMQGSVSLTRDYEGVGLGLAISKGFVEKMGGHIEVSSQENIGTVFTVYLPAKVSAKKQPEQAAPVVQPEYAGYKGITVLVVEDDESSRLYMEALLKIEKIKFTVATDGISAVEMALAEQGPDLIFMDVKMPGIDGYEASRRIKSLRPDIKIVALTAFALSGEERKAAEAGCDAYLSKPVSRQQLMKTIAELYK